MEKPSITFLGHSCFLLQYQGSTLLIDPQNKSMGQQPGDIVYCTHRHFDHTGGVNAFLEENAEAILIGNPQVAEKFAHWEDRVTTVNHWDVMVHKPWAFEFLQTPHGLFKGTMNLGVIVRTLNFAFGHMGDAVRFNGFAQTKHDILAVPIAGGFTASPKRAVEELKHFEVPLPTVVPMHWLLRSPKGFCKRLTTEVPEARCIIPQKGQLLSF